MTTEPDLGGSGPMHCSAGDGGSVSDAEVMEALIVLENKLSEVQRGIDVLFWKIKGRSANESE